ENVYTFNDGYNDDTYRFDLSKVTSPNASVYTSYYPTTFKVGSFEYNKNGTDYICKSKALELTYDYNVIKAFALGDNFVLYLCSYSSGASTSSYSPETSYCYFLFSDDIVENDSIDVIATFTDITSDITTSASLTKAEDVYFTANMFGSITSSLTDILPTDYKVFNISVENGYIIDNFIFNYQNRTLKISRNGIITRFDNSKYTYHYNFNSGTNVGDSQDLHYIYSRIYYIYLDDNNVKKTYYYENGQTKYIDNNKQFDNLPYIMVLMNQMDGTASIAVSGIYHDLSIDVKFISHNVIRFEADDVNILTSASNINDLNVDNYLLDLGGDVNEVAEYVGGEFAGVNKEGVDCTMYFAEAIVYGYANYFSVGASLNLVGKYYSFHLENGYVYNSSVPYEGKPEEGQNEISLLARSTTNYVLADLKPMQEIFTYTDDNGKQNSRSFVKFRLNVVSNDMEVRSYLNVTDTEGNVYASRLDPYSKYTWFNGKTLTKVETDYYIHYKNTTPTTFDYNENAGKATLTYYGRSVVLRYTEIDGYSLATFRILGRVNNLATFDNDEHAINIIGIITKEGITFKYITTNAGEIHEATNNNGVFEFNENLKITTKYENGVYTFDIDGDVMSYLTGGFDVEFYSTPMIFEVGFNSNKQDSSSPVIVHNINQPVKNIADINSYYSAAESLEYADDQVHNQKFVYNQTFNYSDITSAYTQLLDNLGGGKTEEVNTYAFTDNITTDIMLYNTLNETSTHYILLNQITGYVSVNIDTDEYDKFTYTNLIDFRTFDMVGYSFIDWSVESDWENTSYPLFDNLTSFIASAENDNTYAYNFYEELKNKILSGSFNMYARWKAETYTVRFFMMDETENKEFYNSSNLTYARFFNDSTKLYDKFAQLYKVTITFDTNVWDNLPYIMGQRYGYNWLGWFLSKSDDSHRIIQGVDRTYTINNNAQPKFDYDLYLKMVQEGSINEDCGELYDAGNANNTTTKHFYNNATELETYGVHSELDHIITLFAHWEAQTYKLYFYNAIGSDDDRDVVNTIGKYDASGKLTFTNYELYKVVDVKYDETFDLLDKLSEKKEDGVTPLHYDFHSWFRWYYNYDNYAEYGQGVAAADRDANPDKYYNVEDWYYIPNGTNTPGQPYYNETDFLKLSDSEFEMGTSYTYLGYFDDVRLSSWYNPAIQNDSLFGNVEDLNCDVEVADIYAYKNHIDDPASNYVDYDLYSSDKFISALTTLNKIFAGDEHFYAYNTKEKYYADFYDAELNPTTNYDTNKKDEGHYFVTPIVDANGNVSKE
ncbi:MAG: hypothetical protein IJX17_03415, partial [Clostridia bacterium]|nr:hypothetical protein [Clostridia bacterium]